MLQAVRLEWHAELLRVAGGRGQAFSARREQLELLGRFADDDLIDQAVAQRLQRRVHNPVACLSLAAVGPLHAGELGARGCRLVSCEDVRVADVGSGLQAEGLVESLDLFDVSVVLAAVVSVDDIIQRRVRLDGMLELGHWLKAVYW